MSEGEVLTNTIGVAAQVDLDRHAVIEASAGTGKTFTMVELALRLIVEGRAGLERILLITYTEKAAGELRERLRSRLEQALDQRAAGEVRARVIEALDAFDGAKVSTIHAFCARLLREAAYEGGEAFTMALADQRELLAELLRERQRKQWVSMPVGVLRIALSLAGYPGTSGDQSQWEKLVVELAGRYTPAAGDRLLPPADGVWPSQEDVRQAAGKVRSILGDCAKLMGVSASDDQRVLSIEQQMIATGTAASTIDRIMNCYIGPLHDLATNAPDDPDRLLLEAHLLLTSITPPDKTAQYAAAGFAWPCERLKKGTCDHYCPELRTLSARVIDLDHVVSAFTTALPDLTSHTIAALRDDLAAWLELRGLQTFSSMIERVHAAVALGGPHHPLTRRLRDAISYAIVDEFQDTDRLQWEIVRTAFADSDTCRLFIVGDPKQSIYGFRGADVHAYEEARDYLVLKRHAGRYPLTTNYRACPELIEATNKLFRDGRWFTDSPAADEITTGEVTSAEPDKLRLAVRRDNSGRQPLTYVAIPEGLRAGHVRRSFARFVAQEIGRLAKDPDVLLVHDRDGGDRPLRYSDFCILVRTRREWTCHTEALRERSIPYSLYKAPGLWQTAEAMHLHYLLAAIADPGDPAALRSALLSRFMRIQPTEVNAYAQAPDSNELHKLFRKWTGWAEERQWARLFDSILADSPVLLDDLESTPHEWERRVTNYRHLLQILEQEALCDNLDIFDLLERLSRRRASAKGAEDDEDLQRIDTEDDRVQILTIHAAKGLEFPVVFLGGGFSKSKGQSYQHRYVRDGNGPGHWVYDLTQWGGDTDEDASAELRRLFYVAVTRAALRVYVPLHAPHKGQEGPLFTIVRAAAEKAHGGEDSLQRAAVEWGDRGMLRPEQPSEANWRVPVAARPGVGADAELPPELGARDLRRLARFASFSSLHTQAPQTTFAEQAVRADDDSPIEDDTLADVPGGATTGQFFHEALETLLRSDDLEHDLADEPLHLLLESKARSIMPARALVGHFFPQSAQMIRRALGTRLKGLGAPIKALGRGNALPEVEFLYPIQFQPSSTAIVPDIGLRWGEVGPMLTGVIDLVARAGHRHFLVDWKTNRLDSYDTDAVLRNMQAQQYILQHQIYTLALDRWLRSAYGSAYEPEEYLGGVYYLYLRGLRDGAGDDGIYFAPLNAAAVSEARTAVEARLGVGEEE